MTYTNEQIIKSLQTGCDQEEKQELHTMLYLNNQPFLRKMAARYAGDDVDMIQDLMQEGYIGMIYAVDSYDPERGFKFLTFASHEIMAAMQRYLQNSGRCIRVPVHELERIRSYDRFLKRYEAQKGHKPDDSLICAYMQLTRDQLEEIRLYSKMDKLTDLNSPIPGTDGAIMSEIIADPADHYAAIEDQEEHEQLCHALWSEVATLPADQTKVITEHYQSQASLKDIAGDMGKTYNQVRRLHDQALNELRKPKHKQNYDLYMSGWILNSGRQGTGIGSFKRRGSSTEWLAMKIYEAERIS